MAIRFVFLILAIVLGIQSNLAHGQQGPTTAEVRRQLDEILMDLDYLPLKYAREAAFLSNFYVALEILVRTDLPVAVQYAEMLPDADGSQEVFAPRVNTPEKIVYWRYHGAPLVWPADASEPLIADPFFAKTARPRSEWLSWLNPTAGLPHLAWAGGTNLVYNLSVRPNVGISRREDIPPRADTAMVAPLDVSDTCGWIQKVIEVEPELTGEQRDRKKDRFAERTRELVEGLKKKKLYHPEDFYTEVLDCW